jgi:hypothetical protein
VGGPEEAFSISFTNIKAVYAPRAYVTPVALNDSKTFSGVGMIGGCLGVKAASVVPENDRISDY